MEVRKFGVHLYVQSQQYLLTRMIDLLRKTRDLLDSRERRRAILLLGMMLVMGFVEALGVASVMPFIAVVSNPEIIHTNEYLSQVYNRLGFTSTNSFLVFLGCGTFTLVLGTIIFKTITRWATLRFGHMRNYSLSCRLLSRYLQRPYSWFLNRHSADLGKAVLSEVDIIISTALMKLLNLAAASAVAFFLIALVVWAAPMVAITLLVGLGGSYVLVYAAIRARLTSIGADRVRANRERYQIAQEALGGIKDVKVLGLEGGYMNSFRKPAHLMVRRQISAALISEIPQQVLQALAFGGILGVILYLLVAREGDLTEVLPVIALYAFAGMRLVPALQKIYRYSTALRFAKPALDTLHADFVGDQDSDVTMQERTRKRASKPLRISEKLELDQVRFAYPFADHSALKDVTLTIPARTTVGFVGATGAGKTTIVDVILGLLEPQQGELRVDGTPIDTTNARAWQQNIGYVPQHIFLTDDTVTANIAFGVVDEDIDIEAVQHAARIAELHDFVMNELPQGYETLVGERGIRLSGGQRQRIGIARSLYHDPDVLILDEATSALDNLTERAVMDAVHNLARRKTIILIAHRLSTVQGCDQIYLLENGRLEDSGTFEELIQSNQRFRAMAGSPEVYRYKAAQS